MKLNLQVQLTIDGQVIGFEESTGQWWKWNRDTDRWEKGLWTSPATNYLMLTPLDHHE